MPQLIIEQPGMSALTIPVSGSEAHLGRAEDNTVVLVADEVSRHHAKMIRRGDDYVLLDLNSMNGTHFDGRRIKWHPLGEDQSLRIGQHILTYQVSDDEEEDQPISMLEEDSIAIA